MQLTDVIYSHCITCGLQACVHLLLLLHCGFVFYMYWFTTMNVLNEHYLCTLTLKRTLLKMVVPGGVWGQGFRISRLVACIAFTFCLRSFKAWKIRMEKHTLCKLSPTITNGDYRHWASQRYIVYGGSSRQYGTASVTKIKGIYRHIYASYSGPK